MELGGPEGDWPRGPVLRCECEWLWQWGQMTQRMERPIQLGGRGVGVRAASLRAPQRERHELDSKFRKDLVQAMEKWAFQVEEAARTEG